MPVILLTNSYSAEPLRIIEGELPAGFELRLLAESTHEALLESVIDADYILAGGRLVIDSEVISKASKLKMVQRTGVGLDAIDLQALRDSGIPLYVNRGINAQSVAEHTVMLILSAIKRLPAINAEMHDGVWKKQSNGIGNFELKGKTVGVVGMGEIGKLVATMLSVFGVRILYYDPYRLPKDVEERFGVSYMPFEDILPAVDILTFHCALTEQTHNMLGYRELQTLKHGAFVVNTARGGLIDEGALVEALNNGTVAGAALDVHSKEPIVSDNPFLSMPNVILTPHIGGVTYDSFKEMMSGAMHNIECFERGDRDVIADRLYII